MAQILTREKDSSLLITLNRPEALNALSHSMITDITRILTEAEARSDIDTIIFEGAGDRAFCAGGDIKAQYLMGQQWIKGGRQGPNPANLFFKEEYEMNRMIHHYPKKIVSLCDGIVMGGGYGIAGHGAEVIVTDQTKFAMPETGIGLFPDVGISWILARKGAKGLYTALTGNTFDADWMMACGLATRKVTEEELSSRLNDSEWRDLRGSLDFARDDKEAEIERHFSFNSLEEIWRSLEAMKTDFAVQTLTTLKKRCPISLHVTFQHMQMARTEDFDTTIERDYRLACAFFSGADVYEGIRAVIIDKDKNPRWSHSSIFNISQADIDYYLNFGDH